MKNDYLKKRRYYARLLSTSLMLLLTFAFVNPVLAGTTPVKDSGILSPYQKEKIIIKGKIIDESGLTIIGANIQEEGTTNGTITDFDGNFTLSVSANAKIKISYLGYVSQVLNVKGKKQFNLVLKEDKLALDEVVVIGYGTTTKRKMVGSVSSISAKQLEGTPFNSVTDALQGQVSGLIVESSGGSPGSTPSVSIRGGGTPLYVIDGAISTEYQFSVLNSDDIESLSFLKDASATAVYGSKAGNGIVLVNTKRGTKGTPVFRYSTSFQLSEPTFSNERVSSTQYAKAANEIYIHDTGVPLYDEATMDKIINHTDLDNYPDNDFVDLAFKDYAPTTKHNVSVSGGSDHIDYYMSLGYMDQEGIYEQDIDNLKRYTARTNLTSHFDNIGLEVGLNMNMSLQNLKEPISNQWNNLYSSTSPMQGAYNEDGSYASGTLNPLPYIDEDAGYSKTRKKYITTQLTAKWTPTFTKGLSFGFLGSYDDNDYLNKDWTDVANQYYADGTLYETSASPSLKVKSGYGHTLDVQFNANYTKTFGDHTIDGTFVFNRRNGGSQYVSGYRNNFLSSSVDQLVAGSATGQLVDGTETESASEGYVFRAKYDYKSRYIFEFSGRYDGNDNFAEGHKWGFFPAYSGVWIISDEPYMKTLQDKDILNNLKLRASYGEIGVSGGTRFPYLATYSIQDDDESYVVDGSLVTGFSEGDLVNANLVTWYTRKSTNVGLDFASLNNRLQGSLDYFYYETTGFLMSPQNSYSDTLGKDLPEITSNTEHRRAGYELQLTWRDKIGKLNYSIGGNISYYDQLYSELDSEDEATLKNPYTRVTQETDYYGIGDNSGTNSTFYISDGLFQTVDDILNSARPLASTDTQAGDIKYVDENGDGKIDESDMRRIGKPSSPHVNYGITFGLSYDAWSMNGLVQGTGERYMYMGAGYGRTGYQELVSEQMYDYWSPDNTDAFFPRRSVSDDINSANNGLLSDYYVIDGQYIRLKTLSIGYDFKKHFLKNVDFLSQCRLSLSGTNLLTFSKTMDYFDPESSVVKLDSGNNVKARTGLSYPIQRTFSVGLSLAF